MSERWKHVNWEKSNEAIAFEMRVCKRTVSIYRKKLFPSPMVSLDEAFLKIPELKFWMDLITSGGLGDYINEDFDRARQFWPLCGWADSLLHQTNVAIQEIEKHILRKRRFLWKQSQRMTENIQGDGI